MASEQQDAIDVIMAKQKIQVLLREEIDGHKDVFALFPYETGTLSPYSCAGYRIVGQHCCFDAMAAILYSKPAKLTDPRTIELLKDLRAIYTVQILKRYSPARSLNTRKMLLEEMNNRAMAKVFQAWKWQGGYLYSQTSPNGEWRKCNADQTVEYLTERVREAAEIAFEVNANNHNFDDDSEAVTHTEENYKARNRILQFIGGE